MSPSNNSFRKQSARSIASWSENPGCHHHPYSQLKNGRYTIAENKKGVLPVGKFLEQGLTNFDNRSRLGEKVHKSSTIWLGYLFLGFESDQMVAKPRKKLTLKQSEMCWHWNIKQQSVGVVLDVGISRNSARNIILRALRDSSKTCQRWWYCYSYSPSIVNQCSGMFSLNESAVKCCTGLKQMRIDPICGGLTRESPDF